MKLQPHPKRFTVNSRIVSFGFLTLLLLMLAACSTLPEPPQSQWSQHRETLANVDQWQLQGKLGYRSENHNGSAWIHWQEQPDNFDMTLNGPFGAGATRITGTSSRVSLVQAGQEEIRTGSTTELTEWLLGIPLPLEQLAAWVKGIPAPLPPPENLALNSSGQLQTLSQAGWTLDYSGYQVISGQVLPARIRGSKGDITFTLIIKSWNLP